MFFADLFIVKFCSLGHGCSIDDHYVCFILYTDNIILVSASVSGLQSMLNFSAVRKHILLSFNCSKSYCFVGKGYKYNKYIILLVSLGSENIMSVNSVLS